MQIRKYREVFEQVQQQVERLKQAVQTYLGVEPRAGGDVELRIEEQIPKVKKCPGCGKDMGLMTKNDKSGKYLGCFGYPTCKECLWFPKMVKEVTVLDNTCPTVSIFYYISDCLTFTVFFNRKGQSNWLMKFFKSMNMSLAIIGQQIERSVLGLLSWSLLTNESFLRLFYFGETGRQFGQDC